MAAVQCSEVACGCSLVVAFGGLKGSFPSGEQRGRSCGHEEGLLGRILLGGDRIQRQITGLPLQ